MPLLSDGICILCTNAKFSVYGICICGGDFEVEVKQDTTKVAKQP